MTVICRYWNILGRFNTFYSTAWHASCSECLGVAVHDSPAKLLSRTGCLGFLLQLYLPEQLQADFSYL